MSGLSEDELFRAHRNMPKQRKIRLVREPAEGVAIAKCLIHRLVGERKGDNKFLPWDSHPYDCRYCKVPSETLQIAHDEFLVWSGQAPRALFPNVPEDVIVPGGVQAFMALPPDHSKALVWEYQGYEVLDGKPVPKGTTGATGGKPHRIPKGRTRVDDDPDEGLPQDDVQAGGIERDPDHQGTPPVRDAGGAPSQLWATRRAEDPTEGRSGQLRRDPGSTGGESTVE